MKVQLPSLPMVVRSPGMGLLDQLNSVRHIQTLSKLIRMSVSSILVLLSEDAWIYNRSQYSPTQTRTRVVKASGCVRPAS